MADSDLQLTEEGGGGGGGYTHNGLYGEVWLPLEKNIFFVQASGTNG